MKISNWIDQLLIYDQDKLPRRVIFLSLFTGLLLNWYLLENPWISVPVKLKSSVVIYISMMGLVYCSFKLMFRYLHFPTIRGKYIASFLVEYARWFVTLWIVFWYQFEFVYEPILNYLRPQRIDVTLITIGSYSLLFASIIEYFRIDLERFKN